jgi:hypothetical protein
MWDTEREPVQLSREQLYDLVWSKPLSWLADEFGVTGTALAKRCTRLRVPIPGLGYWAKVKAGKTVPRPKLPAAPASVETSIRFFRRVPPPESAVTKTPPVFERIVVPTSVAPTHPVVVGALAKLPTARVEHGFLKHENGVCASIWVSPKTLSRALCLLEALARAAERSGWILANDAESWTYVTVDGARVTVTIMEMRSFDTDGVTLAPNGLLQIELGRRSELSPGLRRLWKDGRSRKLEDVLHEVLLGIWHCAQEIAARQARRDAAQRAEDERRESGTPGKSGSDSTGPDGRTWSCASQTWSGARGSASSCSRS